jgi:hypothetical protein
MTETQPLALHMRQRWHIGKAHILREVESREKLHW